MGWPTYALLPIAFFATIAHPSPASARRSNQAPTCLPVTDHRGEEKVDVSLLRGHRLKGTRVAFRLASATLVVDYAALDAKIDAFLRKNGEERFPYERQVRERLRAAAAKGGELKAEEWLPEDRQHRLDYLLAAMLELGAFEVRVGKKRGFSIYRIASVSRLSGNRRFALPDCQTLVQVLDHIR